MTWEEFEEEIKNLSSKINYTPDVIVGIVRGGIIPARLLSKNLNVKNMYAIIVKKVNDERKITAEISEDITSKQVLLVEDMLETGRSLIAAKKYLEQKGAIVKTVCLYTMPHSEIKPDFYLKEVEEEINFPWE